MLRATVYYANRDDRYPSGYEERQTCFLGVYRIVVDGEEIFSAQLPTVPPAVGTCVRVKVSTDRSPWAGFIGLVTDVKPGNEVQLEFNKDRIKRLFSPDELEAVDVNSQ